MNEVVKKLEVTLGPDTGDLTMRFGLHTGPVTAGVLRGDKSRFQLFGDSVNTAARIENTGERDRIHLSQETADILVSSGKSHWVVEREDKVVVRGKGEMQTYWLDIKVSSGDSIESGDTDGSEEHLKTVAKSLQVAKTYIVKTGRLQRMVSRSGYVYSFLTFIDFNILTIHHLNLPLTGPLEYRHIGPSSKAGCCSAQGFRSRQNES